MAMHWGFIHRLTVPVLPHHLTWDFNIDKHYQCLSELRIIAFCHHVFYLQYIVYLLDLSNKHCASSVSLWYLAIIRQRSPEQCVVNLSWAASHIPWTSVCNRTDKGRLHLFYAIFLNKLFILCKLIPFSDEAARAELRKLPVLPTRTLKERPSITYWLVYWLTSI